ncbi:hypothetical protein FRC08_003344 [Ceratobasidium sp. 394]|nr:hypothetical protein FRC08_003344 [Ceratobasidium sp. 394]
MTNQRDKECQQARKHAQSKSNAPESVAKRPRVKEGTDSQDEIEHGAFQAPEAPVEGFEDEHELDFDELEEQERLLDPDADKEVSPEPAGLDSLSEPRGDSTEPEILPELDITYLMPKSGGTATTPCVLSTHASFMKFQGKLVKCFGVDDFNEVDVTYKLNSQLVKDSPMCLDTLEEYRHMLSEVSRLLIRKGKKSPLPIKIFCKKRDLTPEPIPAKSASIFKASKVSKKCPTAGDNDSVDADDNNSATTPNWKILKTLRKDFACNENNHLLCFNLPTGFHHHLTPTDLSVWALTIAGGRATYSNPPEKLKLTWIEKASKARNQGATQPAVVDAPAPAPPAPAPPIAPYAEFATLVTTLVAALRPPVPAPADPAPAPAPIPVPAPTATKDDTNNHKIDFPAVSDWLTSIVDLFPHLPTHIGALKANGFTHVDHLVMPDVTLKEFMEVTKINYVDSKLLIRKANEVVQELRSMM